MLSVVGIVDVIRDGLSRKDLPDAIAQLAREVAAIESKIQRLEAARRGR